MRLLVLLVVLVCSSQAIPQMGRIEMTDEEALRLQERLEQIRSREEVASRKRMEARGGSCSPLCGEAVFQVTIAGPLGTASTDGQIVIDATLYGSVTNDPTLTDTTWDAMGFTYPAGWQYTILCGDAVVSVTSPTKTFTSTFISSDFVSASPPPLWYPLSGPGVQPLLSSGSTGYTHFQFIGALSPRPNFLHFVNSIGDSLLVAGALIVTASGVNPTDAVFFNSSANGYNTPFTGLPVTTVVLADIYGCE